MFSEATEQTVKKIIKEVRAKGDVALLSFTRKFDGVSLSKGNLRIGEQAIKKACREVNPDFIKAVITAKKNIEGFYRNKARKSWQARKNGITLGEIWRPIESVGIYAPGGKYTYPSTTLMTVIPARIAGVKRIVVVTPPKKIKAEMLVTLAIIGVDEVYQVGGAQAIAALAYGTQTITKVDKIVGPGNDYVTCAKKLVFGDVGIDLLAGPSEVVVLADEAAQADYVVADLAAQFEHGMGASAVLMTTSRDLLDKVKRKLMPVVNKGKGLNFIRVQSIDKGVELINKIAPEHLEILVKNPSAILGKIKNAGAIFLGEFSPVAVGDYIAGPSHVLPTGGAARFSSGLGVEDFMKKSSLISYDKKALKKYGKMIETLAEAEGLQNHAQTIRIRLNKVKK
jgi:histidinol dehydrogenase